MNPLKKIERWREWSPDVVNELIDRINAQGKITGSKGIRVTTSPTGTHLSGRAPSVKARDVSLVGRGYSVKIQAGGVPSNATGPFTCKLLDQDGNEMGAAISVYPRTHLGTNDFDGAVWPDLAAGDDLAVYKDWDGKWYFHCVFDDTTTCA